MDRNYNYFDYDLKRVIHARTTIRFEFIKELDFWNEIEGWFKANSAERPIYVTTSALRSVEVQCDFIPTNDELELPHVGDYYVDKDYKLYRCIEYTTVEEGNI